MADVTKIDVSPHLVDQRVAQLRLAAKTATCDPTGLIQDANFIEVLSADRDRLAKENAVLREALEPFAQLEITAPDGTDWWQSAISLHSTDLRRAGAALENRDE